MIQAREIKSFIFSQYFSDGIRISIGILLPSLVFNYLGLLPVGLTLSLGAMCVSIPDNPGPVIHKRNAMLFCCLFVFLTALLTGLINHYPILLAAEIFIFCFFFSMFSVYGNRASAVGTATLLIMILSIDEDRFPFWEYALYILSGGIWYMLLSLSLSQIRPYRLAQQALAECISELAAFVKIKAEFYDPATDYDENYNRLVDQQVIVNNHQDSVRELLFKSRMIVKESTLTGRLLIAVFVDIVDLFEQTMATHLDYHSIREKYGDTEAMEGLKDVITKLADELENLSYYMTINDKPKRLFHYKAELENLKLKIDRVEQAGFNALVLKKILINIRNMTSRIRKIYGYFENTKLSGTKRSPEELSKFVNHQGYDLKVFRENLTPGSSIFRHAIRVALMCFIGYLVSKLFPIGHHSYWLLMTILVILKPAYSLTKERNIQRLVGTICGGLAGALILIYVKDQTTLFILLLLFMIGSYSFQRLNYIVSVLFMTPLILILFSFLGESSMAIAQERIIDTFLGSFIALTSSYIILPNWEFYQIKKYIREALIANYEYLMKVANELLGKPSDVMAYKLARKEVYVSAANLASAFQRMLSEPKNKRQKNSDIHQLVVLNHILSSYIATLFTYLQQPEQPKVNDHHIKLLRKSLYTLSEVIKKIDATDFMPYDITEYPEERPVYQINSEEDDLLIRQLEFINRLVADIQKIRVE